MSDPDVEPKSSAEEFGSRRTLKAKPHAGAWLPGRTLKAKPHSGAWLLIETLGQRREELDVAFRLGETVEQQLDAFVGADRGKHPTHRPDHLEDRLLEEQLLAAGAGTLDVYGGEDALLGQLAVQDEFAIAGALELLVDHVVHARARVHQAGADDRQRATELDVSGGAEEALGRIEGLSLIH